MEIETLIITMNQNNASKYDSMNVEGNAIISNQIKNKNDFKLEKKNSNYIKFLSMDSIGVGRNRNQALLLANADILVFADDDIIFTEGYTQQIIKDFEEKKIDMMIYSMIFTKDGKEVSRRINKNKKVKKWNCLKYGAASIAVRRESLIKNNIWFSLEFGGGTNYGSGEDSIFIMDFIKKHLLIYSSEYILGECSQDNSTWFRGYNEKFFYDKGALYKILFPKLYYIFIIQYVIRHYKTHKKKLGFLEIIKIMFKGASEY